MSESAASESVAPESAASAPAMSDTYRHFTRLFPYPHERIAVGTAATDAMARYDELAAGTCGGVRPFFLNLNDTVLESMVIAVSLEHDIIDDVETLTPSR